MTAKTILVTVVALLALLFAALNWEVLVALQPLNLLVARVSAPLGLVLLTAILLLSGLYLALALLSRYRMFKQFRDYDTRLQELRDDLNNAHFEELAKLENRLAERFTLLEKRGAELAQDVQESLRGGQAQLEARLLQLRNELSADMAELEKTVRGR